MWDVQRKIMDIAQFKKLPILGIVRGIEARDVAPLVEASVRAGLETLEITMNTKNAASLIRLAVKTAGKRLTVGA